MNLFRTPAPLLALLTLLLGGSSLTARAQITYSSVPLAASSFTADIVANGTAANPATSSTTADADGTGYFLLSQDFYTAATPHTSGLPNNGAIPNTIAGPSALTYQLASLSGNNALRLPGAGTGTVTLATPAAASEVYVLGISGSGASTVDMTVSYTDGTSTVFPAQEYPDWFSASAAQNVFGASSRASAATPVSAPNAANTAPFLSQVKLVIPISKLKSPIARIAFATTAGSGVLNIMAVSRGVAPVCAASPTGATAVASTTSGGGTALTTACASTPVYLSLSGVPANAGYTYQWQASTTSATTGFANLSGATNPTYTATGQASTTYYRALISCYYATPSTAAPSTAVLVAQSPATDCYCAPTYANGGNDDIVTRVRLEGLDNATTGNASPYYRDYSAAQTGSAATLSVPTLYAGTSAPLTLNFGTDGSQYNGVWVDFNQNGVFETSEFFTSGTNAGSSGTATVTIAVPATAAVVAGRTKMRIRGGDDSPPTSAQACGTSSSTYGEAEDYLVNIVVMPSYCTPAYANGGVNDAITRVRLDGLDNATTGNASPYYRDYSAAQTGSAATLPVPTLYAGTPAPLTLNFGSDSNQYNGVWVDFNQNGVFEPSEFFTSGTNAGSSGTATVTIAIPATAAVVAGRTKMRIRGGDDSAPTSAQACGASSSTYGEAEDYLVNIVAVPCTGTPPALTATASAASVCASTSFTLSTTGLAAGTTGVTYQWQSSPTGAGTFANLGAAQTQSTYLVASQTAATDYRVVATCASGSPTTSSTVSVAQTAYLTCYCAPVSTGNNEYVKSVSLPGFTNATGANSTGGYGDFTADPALTASLVAGTTYSGSRGVSLTVRSNAANSQGGLWIDYDHSGTFDASEYTLLGRTSLQATDVTFAGVTLAVPATALAGPTRARVRWRNSAFSSADACVGGPTGWFGETEDYRVSIASPPLPVQLVSFDARPAGTRTHLTWQTASELNSAHFEVERSDNGGAFLSIGQLAAAGNSTTLRRYAYTDAARPVGARVLYYRLRQVDLDGTAAYSPVRVVAGTSAASGLILYPNPAHGGVATLTGAVPGTRVTVYDALGRPVSTVVADATGTAVLALPAELPAGVYVVRTGTKSLRLAME